MNRLILATLILLPFNALPLYMFGSISSEGAFYPLLILILIVATKIVKSKSIPLMDKQVLTLMQLILIFSVLSFVINFGIIKSASHMGRFGIVRFVEQFFQLALGFLITYAIAYSVRTKQQFYKICIVLVWVMAAYIIFGVFQAFAYSFGGLLGSIHNSIGMIVFHSGIPEKMSITGRIHSVSQEPSLLSMYIAVVCPYIIGYALKTKRYQHILFMTIVMYMSFSRTGYVVYLVLVMLIFMLFRFGHLNLSKVIYSIPIFIGFAGLVLVTPLLSVFLSLLDVGENGSNAARYAGVVSAITLWVENNIWFGIGLGQTGFHSTEYLPAWGFISGEIQDVANGDRWPFIHNLLVKILVENGILGMTLWLSLFGTILIKLNRINRTNFYRKDPNAWIGYATFVSVVASLLIMFNRELLSNMNIWVSLGLALSYIRLTNLENLQTTKVKKSASDSLNFESNNI